MTTGEVAVEGLRAPARRGWRRLVQRGDGRAPVWIELAVMAWLFWLYDVINNLEPTRRALALANARGMLDFERSLGIDIERAVDRWLDGHSVLAFVATYYYFFAHVIVTLAVLVLLWWRRPRDYPRLRTQLVIVNLIAFAVFWRYPLAPPRMLPGYEDVVASTHAVISWHSGALVHQADQYAAMPSLHLAWAGWSALGLVALWPRPWVRALGALHVLLTAVVVIATGNHWLLDLVAGFGTLIAGVLLQRALWRAWRLRRRRVTLPELGERGAAERVGA